MRFKIDWASPIVGRKFTVLALFYSVFEGNFPSISPRGANIRRGDLTEGFLRYRFGGLKFGGAHTWRGLFTQFYGITTQRILLEKKSRLAHLSRTGGCKGMFSILCMHFFIACQARIT